MAKIIISDTQFLVFDAQFPVFDTQFLVFSIGEWLPTGRPDLMGWAGEFPSSLDSVLTKAAAL